MPAKPSSWADYTVHTTRLDDMHKYPRDRMGICGLPMQYGGLNERGMGCEDCAKILHNMTDAQLLPFGIKPAEGTT